MRASVIASGFTDEAVVYMKNDKTREVALPKSVKRVILLNCTDKDKLDLQISQIDGKCDIQAYKQDWSEVGIPGSIRAGGTLSISQMVPQGGAAVIKVQ